MADQTRTFEIRFDTRRAIDALRALERAIDGVEHSADDAGRAVRGIASSRNLRRLRRLSRSADRLARGVSRGFTMAAGAVAGFGLALGKVIDIGADFEQSITAAAVKFSPEIRKGTEEYELLEQKALEVGKTTEFTATQSAKALEFFAMAGFDANQAMASLQGAVDLATVSGLSLDRAADIATDTLGAFGLASSDAETQAANLARVNDVLAVTANSANTTVAQMFEAVRQGGSTAAQAGTDIETFTALLSSMANAGIKGGKAGRTLKNVFLRLQAPAAAGRRQLEKLFGKDGIITKSGELKDPIEIIGMLNEKLAGLGTAAQAKILNDIFGKIALPGALVLLKSGNEELEKFRQNARGAAGVSQEMANVLRGTTRGSINALKSAVEGLIISFFKLEDSGIKNTIDAMTEWIRVNEKAILQDVGDWLDTVKENWDKIVRVIEDAAVILGAGGAFWLAIKGIEVLIAAFSLGPIGIAFVAMVTVVTKAVSDMREQGMTYEEILLNMEWRTKNTVNSITRSLNKLIKVSNFFTKVRPGVFASEEEKRRIEEQKIGQIPLFEQYNLSGIENRMKAIVDERYEKIHQEDYERYFRQTNAFKTQQNVEKYGQVAPSRITDEFTLSTQNVSPNIRTGDMNVTINGIADSKQIMRKVEELHRKGRKQTRVDIEDLLVGAI